MNNRQKVAVVYVSLGSRVPMTLVESVEHAGRYSDNLEFFLIADRPNLWKRRFPGTVIPYRKRNRDSVVLELENRFPRRAIMSDGYWIKTVERLFALSSLRGVIQVDTPIIHLESDVLGFLSDEIIMALVARCNKAAAPLVANDLGCASLFFSPSFAGLLDALDVFRQILLDASCWMSDMDVLGRAVSLGGIDSLPTRPENAWQGVPGVPSGRGLLFDAAAIGMYLFGPDSYHDGGYTTSGFQHVDYEHSLKDWHWSLENRDMSKHDGRTFVVASVGGEEVEFANLHLHSKRLMGVCRTDNDSWRAVIGEANGLTPRQRRLMPAGYSAGLRPSLAVLGVATRVAKNRLKGLSRDF